MIELRGLQKLLGIGEYRFVLKIFLIQQFKGTGVRCRICYVLKILCSNIRSAQEIDPLLRIFLVSCILRYDPGVDPEIGTFLGNSIFHIHIGPIKLILNIEYLSGIYDADSRLFPDHLVSYLIDNVCLNYRFLVYKILHSRIQLLRILRVAAVAILLKSHHKGISHRVLHKNLIF